jgi:hypothetical protein
VSSSIRKFVFGVKIYLGNATDYTPTLTQNTNIGLYVESGVAYLRWVQTAITTTTPYKEGILVSIGKIGNAANFRNGGNTAQIPSTEIKISSIDLSQTYPVWDLLLAYNISLIGLKVQIIEFDASTSPATETLLYTGNISESTTYDQETYIISIENNYYKRRTNLATVISNDVREGNYLNAPDSANGNTIPVTFGYNNKALYLNTVKKEDIFTQTIDPLGSAILIDTFPITQKLGDLEYTVKFKNSDSIPDENYFIQIIKGGTNTNEIRLISAVDSVIGDPYSYTYLINDYFSEYPSVDLLAKAESQSWVRFIKIEREYTLDTWPCYNDSTALALGTISPFYAYYEKDNTNGFVDIPQYLFKQNSTFNTVEIVPTLLKDIDTIEGFSIFPVRDINFIRKADIGSSNNLGSIWDTTVASLDPLLSTINCIQNGSSFDIFTISGTDATASITSNLNVINTQDSTANFPALTIDYITAQSPIIPISFTFPDLSGITYDNMYFGLHIDTSSNTLSLPSTFLIRYRNFMGYASAISVGANGIITANNKINNIPDFWDTTNTLSTGNKDFYLSTDSNLGITGYKTIPINGISSDKKDVYQFGLFIIGQPAVSNHFILRYTIKTLVIILSKNIDLSNNVYSDSWGRKFNDSWGGRKNPEDPIFCVVDIIEHILRLQNWSEIGSTVNFGKEYSPGALIYTGDSTSIGSFDKMRTIWNIFPNRQILNYDDCNTDNLLKSLCQQFFFCNYQDNIGRECLNSIGFIQPNSDIVVDLTYSDIIDESVSEITEQHVADVFCEPTVYYNYNYATNKFDSVASITNSNAETYKPEYTTGLSNTGMAESLWNGCHTLWKKYKTINKLPDCLANNMWVTDNRWIALYINQIIQWSGANNYLTQSYGFTPKKWITFSVGYNMAMTIGSEHKPWFPSMAFYLTLPYETAGLKTICIIEKIEFDVNNGKADITAIIMNSESNVIVDTWIQDTFDSYEPDWTDWQDTFLTQAEAPANSYDIQKI